MGSIPLAANNLRVPEQPNALEQYARIMQIKGQQQNQQLQGQEIQKNQMALQDQNIGRKAFLEANGDLDKTVQLAAKYGMSPQGVQQLQLHSVDVKTKTADLVSKQGANAAMQADLMAGAHDAVDKAPAEQKPAAYQQQLQALQQRGIDVSQMPPQYPGDDAFKLIGATVQGHKQQVEDALKQSEGAKNAAQAADAAANQRKTEAQMPGVIAEGKIKQAEADSLSQGGMTQSMADSRYRVISQRKALGQPVSPDDNAFLKTYEKQKTLNATTTFNMQNAGATGTPGQPSAIAKGIADGSIKWNDAVSARTPMNVKQALLSEVKSINPAFKSSDFDVEKRVQEKATSGAWADQLTAINTAREHMATFKQTADALGNGNFLYANKVGNWLGTQFGQDKATNFNVARSAFAGEVGKSFAGANVGVSDRQELIDKINEASSWAQLKGYADTADKLLAGKQKSIKESVDKGMQGKANFGDQSQPSGSYTPPAGAKSAIGPNGHKIVVDGGKWVDAETGKPIQ